VAGLVPAIHAFKRAKRVAVCTSPKGDFWMSGWVYIMTNRPNGTLYVGVTDDLARRAWEHRAGLVDGFTKQYGLTQLVFCRALRRHARGEAARAKYEALASGVESG